MYPNDLLLPNSVNHWFSSLKDRSGNIANVKRTVLQPKTFDRTFSNLLKSKL